MRREGHLRQSQLTQGTWHDEYLYALLRDEWHSQQHTVSNMLTSRRPNEKAGVSRSTMK